MPDPGQSWIEVTRPIVERWKLCAKLNMSWTENAKGCAALATLVSDMARIIDEEIDRRDKQ